MGVCVCEHMCEHMCTNGHVHCTYACTCIEYDVTSLSTTASNGNDSLWATRYHA